MGVLLAKFCDKCYCYGINLGVFLAMDYNIEKISFDFTFILPQPSTIFSPHI